MALTDYIHDQIDTLIDVQSQMTPEASRREIRTCAHSLYGIFAIGDDACGGSTVDWKEGRAMNKLI